MRPSIHYASIILLGILVTVVIGAALTIRASGQKESLEQSGPSPEAISTAVDMEVSTSGIITFTETKTIRAAGVLIKAGYCVTYLEPPKSNDPSRVEQEVVEFQSLSPGTPAYTTGVLHGTKVCLGRIGTPLEPGTYKFVVKRRLFNLIKQSSEEASFRYSFGAPSVLPLENVEIRILFPTIFKGAVRDRLLAAEHLKITGRAVMQGEQITEEEYEARQKADELRGSLKDVIVQTVYNKEIEATVGTLHLKRPLRPKEILFIRASWPTRMYVDSE